MYSVSADFLTAMMAPAQSHKVSGTIDNVTFGPANILAGSFSINNKICDSAEIGIGNVYIGELTATFRNVGIADGAWQGKVITPIFSLLTDPDTDTWEDVPLGVFTVQEATISASGVTVKAYDNMTKFDKYCTPYHAAGGGGGSEASSMVLGRTAFPLLRLICQKCGVDFGMSWGDVAALPNGTMQLEMFSDNDITTFRDLLSWIAQTLCSNATINRYGELILVPFKSASDFTFDDEHRHQGASFKDFTTRITEVWLDCQPMEISFDYHVNPNNGLSYELGKNPFLQIGTDADRDTAMGNILTGLQNVNYTPFDVNLTGCPIFDLGDVLTFTDGILSSSKKGAVTSYTYTCNAAYKISCGGKNPAEATAKSATDKRIDGVSSSVSSEKGTMTVVRNADAVNISDGSLVEVLAYPFEVTDTKNITNVSTEIVMTATATETEAADIFTIGDIVARVVLFLDGIEIGDLYPQFIVDEGKDTINFDYALKNLSVGAHTYTVKLQMAGGASAIVANDVHEFLWGNGITFEVYVKSIQVVTPPTVTAYYKDDLFTTDGMVVRAVNNNGTTFTITGDVTTDPADGDSLSDYDEGDYDAEVNYVTAEGKELETDFEFSIIPYNLKNVMANSNKVSEGYSVNGVYSELGRRKARGCPPYGAEVKTNDTGFLPRTSNGIAFAHPDGFEETSITTSKYCGVTGGFAYLEESGGVTDVHVLLGDYEDGETSDTVVYSYASGSYDIGIDADNGYTGEYIVVQKSGSYDIDIFNLDGSVAWSGTGSLGDYQLSACVLSDGTTYILLGSGKYGTTITFTIVKLSGGVGTAYTVTADGLTTWNDSINARTRIRYDEAHSCIVLVVMNEVYKYGDDLIVKLQTKIYSLDPSDLHQLGVVTPSNLLLPVKVSNSINGTARLYINCENVDRQSNYFGAKDGDGYYIVTFGRLASAPLGVYFDANEEAAPAQCYFGYTNHITPMTYNQQPLFIDNLYFNAGSGNIIGDPLN